jgi:acetyltransferase-like isoleucine patch superfamily enzyme
MRAAGAGVHLGRGVHIEHPEHVELGDGVYLHDYCWISSVARPDGVAMPLLTIGEGTYIGRFATIACAQRVRIGSRVLISDRVFIGDALHGFSQLDVPISQQPIVPAGPVEIGERSWIGIGACILPGVRIGTHCVIGANAVVTHDVPDFHVAAGVPARPLRRMDADDPASRRLP